MKTLRKMLDTRRKKILFLIVVLCAAYISVKNIGLYFVKKTIEHKWAQIFPAELEIGSLNYSLLGRSATVNGIHIYDQREPIVSVAKVKVQLNVLPLMRQRVVFRSIVVAKPHLFLRKEGKKTNIAKLTEPLQKMAQSQQKKEPRKPAQRLPFSLYIKKFHVKNFQLSYFEKFPRNTFAYVIDKGNFLMRDFKFPEATKTPITVSMRLPDDGDYLLDGTLASLKGGKYAFDGSMNVRNVSVAAVKDFVKNNFAIAPLGGVADLTSKINLKGTQLASSHTLKLTDLRVEGDSSVAGMVSGSTSTLLVTFLRGLDQAAFEMKFRLDGDVASKKFDWIQLIGDAMSQAFKNTVADFSGKPVEMLKEAPGEVIKGIEDIF